MIDMQKRALATLEYDKIIAQLLLRCNCCVSRELAEECEPIFDFDAANSAMELTLQAETVYRRSGYSPVDDFPDMREVLKRLHAVLALSPAELLNIGKCLKYTRSTRDALIRDNTGAMLLNLAHALMPFEYIEDEINRCILSEDELYDNASPELSRIRKQMRLANEKVREKLNSMIRSATYQKYLQEPIITMRNGRFVIPVKQEYRSYIPGLIHDQSGSGATLFIEPTAVVELGNEYKKLLSDESIEIERILSELTAMLAPAAKDILVNLQTLGEIDIVFAKAKLAREMNAICPRLNNERCVKIIKGRHPLIAAEKVVPIDMWLGDDFTTLIITGPNTGGKTVTLKTVGLFTLMAMSGMFVPANEGTTLAVFDEVFADIGDEQSIEQSLSTFSSHMKNIVTILERASNHALVLLDELGAGTDPVEGAALAMSILEELHSRGARVLATTHYSEIKAFALSRDGMENASMEFDVNKLAPTYRLFIGIPGKSNAFEISGRLGISDSIIERAREFLNTEDIKFEDIITSADNSRKIAERERDLAEQARNELFELRAEAEQQRKRFEDEREKYRRKAKEEAKQIVADAKRESEALIKKLKELMSKSTLPQSEIDRQIQATRDAMRGVESKVKTPEPEEEKKPDYGEPLRTVKPGETVYVVSLDQTATVLAVPDAKGDVPLQVGILKMTAKLADLRPAKQDKKIKPRSIQPIAKSVPLEMDIRGLMVDEALPLVDKYIEDARNAGLNEINIIHGKGTGALRAGIQSFLRTHKDVKSFRMGEYGHGDAGVTVVVIK